MHTHLIDTMTVYALEFYINVTTNWLNTPEFIKTEHQHTIIILFLMTNTYVIHIIA